MAESLLDISYPWPHPTPWPLASNSSGRFFPPPDREISGASTSHREQRRLGAPGAGQGRCQRRRGLAGESVGFRGGTTGRGGREHVGCWNEDVRAALVETY